jgi:NAD+ synthase (glutamine-hydrolysing)
MSTVNFSADTPSARHLARAIGAYHIDPNIDSVISALTTLFPAVTSFTPRPKIHGGSDAENRAFQTQAHLRMVVAYLFAQPLPTVRQRMGRGSLLVLDVQMLKASRGYFTIRLPISAVSKTGLKVFLAYAMTKLRFAYPSYISSMKLLPLSLNLSCSI